MLGGSAPSQTSGAPYRTESGSRGTGWPSPAHQNDTCSRGYGVYSLFPGPGDTPRTLYTSTAKGSHPSSFKDFVGTQKVSEAFLSTKFTFLSNGTPQFDSSLRSGEQEVSQLDLTRKSFSQASKPLLPSSKKLEEQKVSVIKESKPKRLPNDVVFIKSEVDEGNKIENDNERLVVEQNGGEVVSAGDKKQNKSVMPPAETESLRIRIEYTLASEPDSTVFRTSNDIRRIEDVTTTGVHNPEKESIGSINEVGVCIGGNPVDCSDTKNIIENGTNKEKCNIKVIDSMIENYGKKKKTEKFHLKVESVNDICSRLSEKKDLKTPDNNLKNSLATSRKLNNEPFKPSPNRTLSLSPQNGGCSRTTPVTFRHTSQEEIDPKPQNIHIEVPPLFIKKEPSDFQKNSSGTSFLSPTHLDTNFFSPGGLNVLDGPLLSPLPYSNSFESSNRLKERFSSPLDQNFLSPSQSFLSPRPAAESSFLNSNLDIARFGSYKNYPNLPKTGGNYLINGSDEKIGDGVFLKSSQCLLSREDNQPEVTRVFINSTTESKSKIPENVTCVGSNVTPCQVAEVTSASSLLSPNHSNVNPLVVKQETATAASSSGSTMGGAFNDQNKETAFMTSGQSTLVSSTVGVSSTRQRCQLRLNEIKMSSNNVPSPPVMHGPVQSPASIDLSSATGGNVYTRGMMDDRSPHLITTWPAQTHSPTLWQYSGPIDYPPFPPVGFQLVRDPVTGHFLLIPASNLEALQRAILWPSYQTTPPQMIIPPLSVQPSTPHLLLDTNVPPVDFLTSETIHHSASQHRILIASDNSTKRKITTPAVIKLEASDCSNTPVVSACESEKIYSRAQPPTLSPRKESVFHSQKISGPNDGGRRSQATSPCLTPVLESKTNQPDSKSLESCQVQRITTVMLQDASNQTDLPFETESEACTSSVVCRDKFLPYTRTTEQNFKMTKTQDVGTETVLVREPEDDKSSVLRKIQEKKEAEESLNVSCANVPDHLIIKKELFSPSQVDLSGLELLSNSIEQFVCDTKCKNIDLSVNNNLEKCEINEDRKDLSSDTCEGAVLLQNLRNGFREVEENKPYKNKTSANLGGLGLLCALAEQRFQEEIGREVENSVNNNLKLHEEINETEQEKVKEEKEEEEKEEKESKQNIINDLESLKEKDAKECDFENYQTDNDVLPTLKREVGTEDEIQPTVPNKLLKNDDDSSNSGLDGEKSVMKRGPGRPKKHKNLKKDINVSKPLFPCSTNRNSKEMSPPVLEKETDYAYNEKADLSQDSETTTSEEDILKPPTLIPSTILDPVIKTMAGTLDLTPCEVSLIALKISRDKLKKSEKNDEETLSENEGKKRKLSDNSDPFSSSKKRKVGRPKKHLLNQKPITETIVAKKPKTKTYLYQPVQTVENSNCLKTNNNEDANCEKSKKIKNSFVSLEADANNVSDGAEEDEKKLKKIRPKLKAEPKIKELTKMQDEENVEKRKDVKKEDKQKMRSQKKVAIEEKKLNDSLGTNRRKESTLPSCVLRTEHLKNEIFPIRTLTAMGGLFYAGQLSAIRAPDVYGITIDGERGNRPHIYSREEILKDSILEIKPEKTSDLHPGTRCCAYWSEQYRCLYPGTVSAPVSPNPELDDKFVNVEFDDGDSGKINIDDIRLLPEDYPIVEYDPNPLQSLSKRKRRISGTSVESHSKERKSVDSLPSPAKNENVSEKIYPTPESVSEETEPKEPVQVLESGNFLSLESERKHLKKKRREKLKRLQSLSIEGKKKHKKHKCSDEHRHHRHHKKHKKHKHKHGKKHGDEIKGEVKKVDDKTLGISTKGKEELILKKKNKNTCKSVENSCKLSDKSKTIKPKKCKERTESVESRSKMAAFLPARQLWGWSGKGYRRPGAKGRARKEFYKTIQRGKERITVGDCAVFLSTGRPDRPYIGRIESMWESWGTNMIVRVKWFYHPEETVGCPATLEYPGALFESPHVDENDVQTISHKCEVLPLKEYNAKIGNDPHRYETIYDNNDIYYLAGYYDPTNTTLKMEPGVK